jgi:hypothetical protein
MNQQSVPKRNPYSFGVDPKATGLKLNWEKGKISSTTRGRDNKNNTNRKER